MSLEFHCSRNTHNINADARSSLHKLNLQHDVCKSIYLYDILKIGCLQVVCLCGKICILYYGNNYFVSINIFGTNKEFLYLAPKLSVMNILRAGDLNHKDRRCSYATNHVYYSYSLLFLSEIGVAMSRYVDLLTVCLWLLTQFPYAIQQPTYDGVDPLT